MIPSQHAFWMVFSFVFGALWGSFLNVVIFRLPAGLSVIRPGSRCSSCMTPIPWYLNVPILSWLVLRGRCHACGARFSVRYPLIEAAMGLMAVSLWLKFATPNALGTPPVTAILVAWAFFFIFVALLISISLIDLDTMLIPDILSVYPIPLGICAAWLCSDITGVSVVDSVLGMLLGGGTLLVVTYGYFALTGREGMGLGDYRLMALVGAFLGWRSLLFMLLASALQGLLFAIVTYYSPFKRDLPDPDGLPPELAAPEQLDSATRKLHADELATFAIPFGPFIALSAIEWLTFEPWLMSFFRQYIFAP